MIGATSLRVAAPLLALGAASALIYGLGFPDDPAIHGSHALLWRFYPALSLALGASWWVWRRPGQSVLLIVTLAALFRLLAAQDTPRLSSDVHRYAWDGRVQRAGFSPYAFPPSAPELRALRDTELHPRINRPDAVTVYPPGSQVLLAALPYSLDAVRAAMIALELAGLALLALHLRGLGLDPARIVLWAWHPLAVYEVGQSGHLEAALLPLLVGVAMSARARPRLAGALVGVAGAIKLYPMVALAALAGGPGGRAGLRHAVRTVAPALAVVAGLYAAYAASAGAGVLGFLPQYVGVAEDHNIGLRALLEVPLGPVVGEHARTVAFGLCVATLGAGAIAIARSVAPVERKLLYVAGLYLLTLPAAFHPWYALWLLPWLCVHPRASWLWLLGALPLSYLQYGAPGGRMPAWVVPLELLPTAGLLAAEAWRTRSGAVA